MGDAVHVRCPSIGCRQVLSVPAASRGLLVTCPLCQRAFRVPQARPSTNDRLAVRPADK